MSNLKGILETNADDFHLNSLIKALRSEGHFLCAFKILSAFKMRQKYPGYNTVIPSLTDEEFAGLMSVWCQSMGAFEFKQFFSFIPDELIDPSDYKRYYEIREKPVAEILLKIWSEPHYRDLMGHWGHFDAIAKYLDEIFVKLKCHEDLDLESLAFISGFWDN